MNKKLIGIIVIISFMFSCNNNDDNSDLELNQVCDSSNTTFNQLFNNVLSDPSNIEEDTMDVATHGFTFEVTSNATICGIGYRSQSTFELYPYLIEIYDNTNNVLVYSDNHTFSSTNTEYVSIGPIILTGGNSYTIKRIQNNFTNDITILIVISQNNVEMQI